MKSFVLEFFIAARFANLAVSLPHYQFASHTYRLTYTLTETDGGKRVGTQHFAMIVVSGRKTVLKQGNRVPLVTGSVSTSGGPQTQVQYLDIGLNIDASIEESADGVKLNTQVEQSSIAEEKSGLGTQDPIVRQAKLEGTSILAADKPSSWDRWISQAPRGVSTSRL